MTSESVLLVVCSSMPPAPPVLLLLSTLRTAPPPWTLSCRSAAPSLRPLPLPVPAGPPTVIAPPVITSPVPRPHSLQPRPPTITASSRLKIRCAAAAAPAAYTRSRALRPTNSPRFPGPSHR
ncbi:uncharacterized protein LOC129710444 [Leucoraja erinacea]|uniref:uncharacterized protein LOC129710444 n=1 Tax=Leucoraja erinaceus TaxID=7782 RepID=UPI002453779C|nr:uncharacterized protein LOC129710444 [Leucoraja erinacea]